MERAIESEARSWRLRPRQIKLLAAIIVMVSLWTVFISWRSSRTQSAHRNELVSPYQNTRPEVKYLGDSACIGCHRPIAEAFRQHPMGRSLAPIEQAYLTKGDEGAGRTLFESQGIEYSIEHRDGHVFHQETRRDASGRMVARNEAEVQFVIGSGRQGAAYLVERDGFLFESPITWYSRRQRWDLSPGFEAFNFHFDRATQPNCLYCHANRVEPEAGPVNRYRQPIFQGHAIGCERCHGPGELHVARPTIVGGKDITIVNPADLAPALRDDVCASATWPAILESCGWGGAMQTFDPGCRFISSGPYSYSRRTRPTTASSASSNRCTRANVSAPAEVSSDASPATIPTISPRPRRGWRITGVGVWRVTPSAGCSLPAADRLVRSKDDDCIGCHMPKTSSFDVPHSASANHRVPRHASGRNPFSAKPSSVQHDKRHTVIFYRERLDAEEQAEVERDRGIALCREGAGGASEALALIETALAARSLDVAAWECKGHALASLGRHDEALAAYAMALTLEPSRESALAGAARVAAKMGRTPGRDRLLEAAPSRLIRGVRTITENWPSSISTTATGRRRPTPAGRPFASIPSRSVSGSCSCSAISIWETPGLRAASSIRSWGSIRPTGRT